MVVFAMGCPSGLRGLSLALLASTASAAVIPRDPIPDGFVAPPYYPSPYGGWADDWAESYSKATKLVSQMTVAEKVNITAGTGLFMVGRCVGNTGSVPRLGFPQLCLQDGPLGIRSTDNNTAFPAGITTGATFNKELIYQRGVALGEEFRGKGANFYLGPSVGALGRKPRGGRNWEGFGSDPVLQAIAGAETIKGVQEQGVIATLKHLIGNEQELYRMYNPFQRAYSANIDDRTMHEVYLWPFAEGVRAGAGSIMSAYNDVNGSAASQNSYLLNGLLKDELGFQGFVMTDWLSQISGVAAALAGLDMSMPGDTIGNAIPLTGHSHWMYELTRSVLNGSVPVDRLNDMATRIVATWYQFGQDKDFPPPNFSTNTADREGPLYPGALFSPSGVVNEYVNVQGDHKVVAKQVAQEAITLLKNDGGFLPLSTSTPLFVFGTDAQADPRGINSCVDKSCNRGLLGMGWGSGSANYPYLDDPISSLRRKAANVTYYATNSFPSVQTPGGGDTAIVFISSDGGENTYTVEGNHGDRDASGLVAWYNGDELVQKAAAKYSNVVVVVHTVGPIVVEPWIDLPSVKAVLVAHLPGQEAGDSLTELLFGEASPSGHLPYTIPVSEKDFPDSVGLVATPLSQTQDTYSEGIYIDYRYLNKHGIKPRFAFGHGLSYASFTFSNATIKRVPNAPLSEEPPARPPKLASPIAGLDVSLPDATEAYYPESGLDRIWRYLYPWLDKGDADKAYTIGVEGREKYPYPEGYSPEQRTEVPVAGGTNGGNPALWDAAYEVTVTVTNTNTGKAPAGKAVAQAYVQFPAGIAWDTPPVQLRDFAKTGKALGGGESAQLRLSLTRRDVSVWDVVRQNWIVPNPRGRYAIWVGDASDNLRVACYTDTLTCEEGLEPPV
ncbi:glycoside hydrolase family 3 protein [Durotheca rogersii]|uniref:glycoside hydrolase family 3 protein n=1 Tax=Durotheca rogersii TaxID=419775 RepID=UPI0022200C78|nr:glycoside hydrolase family 3 protein [Durotheca rogersii]KAI5867291.1 glycoside hydrolase family 3 protein [Durotheca rogersii]